MQAKYPSLVVATILEDTHLMQTVIRETIEEVGISLSKATFFGSS